jgi:serpin B
MGILRAERAALAGLGAVAVLATMIACGSESGDPGETPLATEQEVPQVQLVNDPRSSLARVEAPAAGAEALASLTQGNTEFALDLYQQLRAEPGNLFYSPYSISIALAMTYAGAEGETEAEIARSLHYLLPEPALHEAFNALDQELAARGEGARGKDGEGFRLNIANSLWGQEGHGFRPEFLDTLALNYGAGLELADFARDPEGSRTRINDWVEEQTEDRIKDLIPEGVIDSLTRLVLANAVYFNAAWQHPFEEAATSPAPFHLLDGSETAVDMMRQTESHRYGRVPGAQAVELLYDGRQLSMVVILPDEGEFERFEEGLDSATMEQVLASLKPARVDLSLPKFEFEAEFALKDALQALGMPAAFGDQADFSGIDGSRDLRIAEVVHKAFVAVDEAGTEAAAATAVIVATRAMLPEDVVTVTVDRPFLFLIRDNATGTVLFLGRVLRP